MDNKKDFKIKFADQIWNGPCVQIVLFRVKTSLITSILEVRLNHIDTYFKDQAKNIQ
jgi:hypothetical protein